MSVCELSKSVNIDTKLIGAKTRVLNGEFLENLVVDPNIYNVRPWKSNIKYFTKTYISSIAIMKMAIHAQMGGDIEIMGVLVGKVYENSIIVNDVYSLPVEGTETRVNAQLEGYEFMVNYLQQHKLIKPQENIVGWYHSHPNYGCWLSGIDIATQELNQNFQDPYMAIVIDPIRSISQGKIEIGAFRTIPDSAIKQSSNKENSKDFGVYSNKYYSLDIEIFKMNQEDDLIKLISKETWINDLLLNSNRETKNINQISSIITRLNANKTFNAHLIEDNNLKSINSMLLIQQFNSQFNQLINEKLSKNLNVKELNIAHEANSDYDISEGNEESTNEYSSEGEGEAADRDGDDDDDDEDDDDEEDEEDEDDHLSMKHNNSNRNYPHPHHNSDYPVPHGAKKFKWDQNFKLNELYKDFNTLSNRAKQLSQQEIMDLIQLDIQAKLFE